MLSLPISPKDFTHTLCKEALKLLPDRMTSDKALVMLCAIALQESALNHRWQVIDFKRPNVKGPARGLLQFERGTRASRGGVWGVYLHSASKDYLKQVCDARGVNFEPNAIYERLEQDDILAICVARLLLWTDPKALPNINDSNGAWELYMRTWRPGKPKPNVWPNNHKRAVESL